VLFLCFYTLYLLTVFFVYVHICIVCYPCGVTINDDDDDIYVNVAHIIDITCPIS